MKIPQIKINFKALFCCGLAGVLLMVIGIYAGFYLAPNYVNKKILEAKVLREDTDQWETFIKVPFPFHFKVYLFTIQNPEGVLAGAKPLVKERGPYVYQLSRWKDQVAWNMSTDEISYNEYESYEFDAEASGELSEADRVTVLNPAFLSFMYIAERDTATRDFLPLIDGALDAIFGAFNSPFFIKVTVKDLLFDGLRICKNGGADDGFVAKMACSKIKQRITETRQMRADGDDLLYATFHYRNNTHQGYTTVTSGRNNMEKIGEITQLDKRQTMKVWVENPPDCNLVSGLTSVFPSNVGRETTFRSFSEDICRAVSFEYSRKEIVGTIKGNRYEAMKSTFNTKDLEENGCFCTNHTENLDGKWGCLYDGVLDLTTCQGSPVLVSFPHLLYADSRYLLKVDGLEPDKSRHAMFITLEPTTGTPLRVAKRVQFNMMLRPVQNISSMEALGSSLVPMFWIEESTTLPEKYQNLIKSKIYRILLILDVIRYTVLAVSVAVILCCTLLFIYSK